MASQKRRVLCKVRVILADLDDRIDVGTKIVVLPGRGYCARDLLTASCTKDRSGAEPCPTRDASAFGSLTRIS
jgi:hypothetical protein